MRRSLLLPLTPIYRAAIAARSLGYSVGWIRPQYLRWLVVSVGSISTGGAGKTPLVIRLAELFKERSVLVDVLSRGYGRSSIEIERVDPEGTADRFGDEPLLIARSADVPVFVGASRLLSGRLAENAQESGGVHLLDDGFQHRRLGRQSDIVLVSARDFEDRLLPCGNLREPLSSLRRATLLAVRSEEPGVVARLRARGLSQPILLVHRCLNIPEVGNRLVVFCGIARPQDFFFGVKKVIASRGATTVSCQNFPDHHNYSVADVESLARIGADSHANGFLTTEKDGVKLSLQLREILEKIAPVSVVELRVTLENESGAMESLIRQLGLPPVAPIV